MRMKRLRFWTFLAAVPLVASCEANQLYMGSRTVVGVNAAVNPEQTEGRLVVGYDRDFAAVVPRSAPGASGRGRDAMSALVCSELAVSGLTIRRYTESLATGEAAATFAANLHTIPDTGGAQAIKDFFDCFRRQDPPVGAPR